MNLSNVSPGFSLESYQRAETTLPHYNVNSFKDLPADAAPEGTFANGDIYYQSYKMLTPSDISFLKSATGEDFTWSNIKGQIEAGTFKGDPLAAAIGTSRADAALGMSDGLTGNVTASYLNSIEATMKITGDGSYDGIAMSQNELNKAYAALGDTSTTSTVSTSV